MQWQDAVKLVLNKLGFLSDDEKLSLTNIHRMGGLCRPAGEELGAESGVCARFCFPGSVYIHLMNNAMDNPAT